MSDVRYQELNYLILQIGKGSHHSDISEISQARNNGCSQKKKKKIDLLAENNKRTASDRFSSLKQ